MCAHFLRREGGGLPVPLKKNRDPVRAYTEIRPPLFRMLIMLRKYVCLVALLIACPIVLSAEGLTPDQIEDARYLWPKEVTLKQSVTFTTTDGTLELPAGSKVKVITMFGGNLTLESNSARASVSPEQTDFFDQLQAKINPTSPTTVAATPTTSTNDRSTKPSPSTPPPSTSDTSDTPNWHKLNDLFGIPLWADDNLFADPDQEVAARLHWTEESSTPEGRSYRLYAKDNVKVLGARPYSLALYAADGKVEQLSLVFANKGDYTDPSLGSPPQDPDKFERYQENLIKGFAAKVRSDGDTIADGLTKMLGPPDSTFFGVGMKEKVRRWDWQGHSFLLATPRQEYVLVRIMSVDCANNNGRVDRLSVAELKERLIQKVVNRPNGDVVIKDIPMVDQGPKGYCVPATWERYLRFLGIPADMYVLAMAGGTGMGKNGGTDPSALKQSIESLVSAYGRAIDPLDQEMDLRVLARYIDKGVPLMWECMSTDTNEEIISANSAIRLKKWEEYKSTLGLQHHSGLQGKGNEDSGHMRMIIGYNKDTNEVAISDSWGPGMAERWITLEDAKQISLGLLIAVRW